MPYITLVKTIDCPYSCKLIETRVNNFVYEDTSVELINVNYISEVNMIVITYKRWFEED